MNFPLIFVNQIVFLITYLHFKLHLSLKQAPKQLYCLIYPIFRHKYLRNDAALLFPYKQ